jgi:hypothetical protein
MGADITFIGKEGIFYFRDAYNETNLAWIKSMSYWQTKGNLKQKKNFFIKLSQITNDEIKAKVDSLKFQKAVTGSKEEWIKMFKEKREDIRDNLKIIKTANDVTWSV